MEVSGSPTRCPYCHDAIDAREFAQALVCEQCLSRHHADCWHGGCASCGGEAALGRREVAAGASRVYELAKHAANWGYLLAFVGCFPAMLIDIARMGGLPPDDPQTFAEGQFPIAFMSMTLLATGLSVLMWVLNSIDAMRRREADAGAASASQLVLALISPLTGGLTGLLYYLLWGRKPLPQRGPPAPPPRPGPAVPEDKAADPELKPPRAREKA